MFGFDIVPWPRSNRCTVTPDSGQSGGAGAAGPHVLLVIDDESAARFGRVTKLIVVGLMDAAVRVTVLARTLRLPDALELGPCTVIHVPPSRWRPRAKLRPDVAKRIAEAKVDVVQCLSVRLLEWVLRQPEFGRFPIAAHITDSVDLLQWATVGKTRPRLWALPSTPVLSEGVLRAKCSSARFMKLVRLGITGRAATSIMAAPDHIASAIVVTPLVADCGLDCVLYALQAVLSKGHETALFVLGTGPAERRFRRLAQQLRLHGAVTFVGKLSQWEAALPGCDILLVPRRPARWSCHVLQAMVVGRAVLAPRDHEEDNLLHDRTACLFAPGDPADLAVQWGRLVAEPETACRIGEGAQEFVKTQHSLSVMESTLVELYGEMLAPAAG